MARPEWMPVRGLIWRHFDTKHAGVSTYCVPDNIHPPLLHLDRTSSPTYRSYKCSYSELEMLMQSEIKRWGNSAAVRLSRKILAQARLDIASQISIGVQSGKIIIEASQETSKKVRLPFTENDLLTGLDAQGAHADLLAAPSAQETGN
jgi:antitoxin MazE